MALERVPADIRARGGVARMSDPKMIKDILEAVTIPVMAKARIGHFVECQVHECFSLRERHYHCCYLCKVALGEDFLKNSADTRGNWSRLH